MAAKIANSRHLTNFAKIISIMDHLPLSDAFMLASSINFLLRDHEYESLDEICNCFGVDLCEVELILSAAGMSYDKEKNTVK